MRQNKDGNFTQCGHVQIGIMIPPQNCPGEEDLTDIDGKPKIYLNGPINIVIVTSYAHWIMIMGIFFLNIIHAKVVLRPLNLLMILIEITIAFKSFNLECSAITENGKIREIVIDKNGSKYFSPTLALLEPVDWLMQYLFLIEKEK